MTIDDKIWDENLQDDINREATKIPALSSGKVDLKAEKTLPCNRG